MTQELRQENIESMLGFPTLKDNSIDSLGLSSNPIILLAPGCYDNSENLRRANSLSSRIDKLNPDLVITLGGNYVLDSDYEKIENELTEAMSMAIELKKRDTGLNILLEDQSLDSAAQALLTSYLLSMQSSGIIGEIYLHTDYEHLDKLTKMIGRIYGHTTDSFFTSSHSRGNPIKSFNLDDFFNPQYKGVETGNLDMWFNAISERHNLYDSTEEIVEQDRQRHPKNRHMPHDRSLNDVIPSHLRNMI